MEKLELTDYEKVQKLIQTGDKISAIKEIMQQTGVSIRDAKTYVDNFNNNTDNTYVECVHERRQANFSSDEIKPEAQLDLPDYNKVQNLIMNGRKIEAIKELREQTGLSLYDAREYVEKIESKLTETPGNSTIESIKEERKVVEGAPRPTRCPKCGSSQIQASAKKILGIFKTAKMECMVCKNRF